MSEKRYKVFVDDNFHHGQDVRYESGSYDSLEEAIENCKELTIESLEHFYEAGISPEELSAQWALFGEDPYIVGAEGRVPFSARKFITIDLCQEIIDSIQTQ